MWLHRWWNMANISGQKRETNHEVHSGFMLTSQAHSHTVHKTRGGTKNPGPSSLRGTHMLSGSCTLAWASSSEVMDATLGGTSTPAEEGEGPGGDASYKDKEES